LYDPNTNIRIGTYYLKELVEQFQGSRAHAIAAYNASPEVVRRWLEQEKGVADDEFVDSVPYGETRRYLRRVLRSYRMYQLLYAPEAERDASSDGSGAAEQTQSRPH